MFLFCSLEDHRHREEAQATQANLQENNTRYEGEIRRLFEQLQNMSPTSREQPCNQSQDSRSQSAASSCSSKSSGSIRLTRKNSVPNLSCNQCPADGQNSSSEDSRSSGPSPSQMVRLADISTVLSLAKVCSMFFFFSLRSQRHPEMRWCLISWRKKA